MAQYRYSHTQKKCSIVDRDKEMELPILSKSKYQTTFQHEEAELTIEELSNPWILSMTLRNVKHELPTIFHWQKTLNSNRMEQLMAEKGWDELADEDDDWFEKVDPDELEQFHKDTEIDVDYGQVVWNKEKRTYQTLYYQPKMFNVYFPNINYKKDIYFAYDFQHHIVDKDKEEIKPWYYYKWDWTPAISNFLYQSLNPHFSKEKNITQFEELTSKEIVIIPEDSYNICAYPWEENDWNVHSVDMDNLNFDFALEDSKSWNVVNEGMPQLVISYSPTNYYNYNDPNRLTGTRWLKQLWSVFDLNGSKTPLVLKTYTGFVHYHLAVNYPTIFGKIDAMTILPNVISNRCETTTFLLYFNMPWLRKKGKMDEVVKGVANIIPWDPKCDKFGKIITGERIDERKLCRPWVDYYLKEPKEEVEKTNQTIKTNEANQ